MDSPILVSAVQWQGRFTLFSSDGVGITLDSLLYGAYTDGLSNPGLSSTMAGTVHTLLLGWRRYYVGLIVIWSLY